VNYPDWEFLLKDGETGKAVWLVRGKCGWKSIVVRQVKPDEAHCIPVKMSQCENATTELSNSLRDHGFNRVSVSAGSKIKWFHTGSPFDGD